MLFDFSELHTKKVDEAYATMKAAYEMLAFEIKKDEFDEWLDNAVKEITENGETAKIGVRVTLDVTAFVPTKFITMSLTIISNKEHKFKTTKTDSMEFEIYNELFPKESAWLTVLFTQLALKMESLGYIVYADDMETFNDTETLSLISLVPIKLKEAEE